SAGTSGQVTAGSGNIGRRPGITSQQVDHGLTDSAAKARYGLRNQSRIGNSAQAGLCAALPLTFVVEEEEGLVFYNRTAQRSAELVVGERVLGLTHKIEIVASAERAAAVVLQRRAVQLVRAALGDDVDDGATVAAVLGFVVGEHVQQWRHRQHRSRVRPQ